MAEALAKTLKPGQPLWLNGGEDKFLAIFIPDQSGQPKGGAIILHDATGHPDWRSVIRPLRNFLPPNGWATISIQLPQLSTLDGQIPLQQLVNSRIQKAAEHLHSLGLNNIALIGHGSGALAAATYLATDNADTTIRGFVGISLEVTRKGTEKEHILTQLEKIKLPILDIYGSRDLGSVTKTAGERALAAKKSSSSATGAQQLEAYKKAGLSKTANNNVQGYISYRQVEIEGANHDFDGMELILNKRILGWLERHAKGTIITAPK